LKKDISELLKKQVAPKGDTHVVLYDLDTHKALKELALKENTTASSIIYNLVVDFLQTIDTAPNTTLDLFDDPNKDVTIPSIYGSREQWEKYIWPLNMEERKRLQKAIIMIDGIWAQPTQPHR